jgi:prepilin signal peptidase PulO-like enzyme (type II secretory pathway)
MALILAIPFELRLIILFVAGCALGGLCNWAVYRLAYRQRSISPWSAPPPDAPPRRLIDRIPVFGWLGLSREEHLYGRGFWIRPMVVELLTGGLLAGLYWWETEHLGLLTPALRQQYAAPGQAAFRAFVDLTVHSQYLAHAILLLFMIVASLIDADEKTIPDIVTIPGTLLGLALITALPSATPPQEVALVAPPGAVWIEPLTLASPNEWPPALDGAPRLKSLAVALACYWLWCFALLPRVWRTRHGLARAWAIFTARLAREPFTGIVARLAALGIAVIGAIWLFAGATAHWRGLLTSLVGLAAGGGIVWVVRIVGHVALKKEAMGFGDVTLMAMIGSFVGWHPCLFIFFLAPFAGLFLGVVQWLVHREHELPYGPFLCLATLFVLVNWAPLWDWAAPIFAIPWLVPAALAACMALMLVLLTLIRLFRGR